LCLIKDGGISRIRLWGEVASVAEVRKMVVNAFENTVKSVPLKDEHFINFGEVFNSGEQDVNGAKVAWRAKLLSEKKDSVPQFFSVNYPKQSTPYLVKTLEKHANSSQTYIPMNKTK
jgi:ureidoglycolate hydrolase